MVFQEPCVCPFSGWCDKNTPVQLTQRTSQANLVGDVQSIYTRLETQTVVTINVLYAYTRTKCLVALEEQLFHKNKLTTLAIETWLH